MAEPSKTQIAFAEQMLDKLKKIDRDTQRAYYEMGQILLAINKNKLFGVLGYSSFGELVEEELSFSRGTATTYMYVYRRFSELKYNKTEAITALQAFGCAPMQVYLRKATQKVSFTTLKKHMKKLHEEQRQMTFWLSRKKYERLKAYLEANGAQMTDQGRLMHTSDALMNVLDQLPKQAAA